MSKQVEIDGITYKSMKTAAKELNVPYQKLIYCIRNNLPVTRTNRTCKPIKIDGVVYPSIAAAARGNGLSYNGLTKQINKGRLIWSPDRGYILPHREQRITVWGRTFPSRKAAEIALGKTRRQINVRLYYERTRAKQGRPVARSLWTHNYGK